MKWAALVLALACSCDGVRTHPLAGDAPGEDAADDASSPVAHHYVVATQRLPSSPLIDASNPAVDLTGDSVGDNSFGRVLGYLATHGLVLQTSVSVGVRRGDVLLLAEVTARDLGEGPATFALFTGDRAGTEPPPCPDSGGNTELFCGQHLDGTATIPLSPSTARDAALTGTFVAGELSASGAVLEIDLALGTAPTTLRLVDPRVVAGAIDETGIHDGIIAGAISQSDLDSLVAALLGTINAALAAPACSYNTTTQACMCTDQSANDLQKAFDAGNNCAVSEAELRGQSMVMPWLVPDLSAGVSFGMGFTAVPATFTP